MTTVVILGATATGKSGLAIELASRRGGEIVNADALQAYRGLDIGTSKPSRQERETVPHHLFDVLDPRERFSAGAFARLARARLGEIASRGRDAVVVGGSGLYLRALLEGLAEIPDVPDAVRSELAGRADAEGIESLHAELSEIDPRSASRIPPRDTQRIVRALSVARATGRPLSEWISRSAPPANGASAPSDVRKIGLTLSRAVLYDRIESRVHEMMRRGWVEEVRALLRDGLASDAPALQAIGYRELIAHLSGALPIERAVEEIVKSTRRYAKRQETWFRRETAVVWLDAVDPARLPEAAERALAEGA